MNVGCKRVFAHTGFSGHKHVGVRCGNSLSEANDLAPTAGHANAGAVPVTIGAAVYQKLEPTLAVL